MTEFEATLVRSYNNFFSEYDIKAVAYRLKQSRFAPQFIDIAVDSSDSDLYLGVECKSISVDKGAHGLYFKSHFTVDKKGIHQVERISDFLEKTGRKGFLAVELRMGIGQTREAYMVPWDVVQKKYREKEIKIPLDQIRTHGELKRRGKTYGLSSLFEPLKITQMRPPINAVNR